MKKWIVFFSIFICLPLQWAHAANSTDDEKSQLLERLQQIDSNDTTQLGIYLKLIYAAEGPQVKSYYTNKLLNEAKRLNSSKYQCEAYLRMMVDAHNQYDTKEINRLMKLLEPIAQREKLYDYWFLARRCVVDLMLMNGEYEREIKAAQKMLQDAKELDNKIGTIVAYQLLATGYRMTYRVDKAIELFEKAYHLAVPTDKALTVEITNLLIGCFQSKSDYKKWFEWTQIMDRALQKFVSEEPDSWQGWQMLVAVSYINYYTSVKDFENAAKYIKQAEAYSMDSYSIYSFYHHEARYSYFNAAELYEEALKETEILAEIYKERFPLSYSSMKFFEADILQKLERYDESIEIYKQSFKISDSINIAFLNKQTEQMKKDYNADLMLLESATINKNIQLIYLCLIGLLIITCLVFMIHSFRVRKGLRMSEAEMRKMAEEMELANVAKENFLATISTAINVPLTEVVNGSLQLANDEVVTEEDRKKVSETINHTSSELMVLINNILELSRLEAGMMKFKSQEVEVAPFVNSIVTWGISMGRDIDLQLEETPTPLLVYADTERLTEVMRRLLQPHLEGPLKLCLSSEEHPTLKLTLFNSMMASDNKSRDVTMGNEINRLTIEHFKGRYSVDVEARIVTILLPLV